MECLLVDFTIWIFQDYIKRNHKEIKKKKKEKCNQTYNEVSPHNSQNGHYKNLQTTNAGEDVEKRESLAQLVRM